ncbi:hypothetical protein AQJ64_37800 [Streptomyces griseoruber]|uniref:Uncharacterized protein n=1 Tax=Streptomyces griseoruber TaxID=1943 RepID=A0A124I188_9ACTN|nr:hypothetical protein AQJ64_37800 [Streptomyces griseoruber]
MAAGGGRLTAVGDPERDGWRLGPGRRPFFALCEETDVPGTGHGLSKGASLCGIPGDRLTVYRGPFDPTRDTACPGCRAQVLGDPEPTLQDLLRHRVRGAVPGPLRAELLAALKQGAQVGLWVSGRAAELVRRHARRERIVEGGALVEAVVGADGPLGLARVVHGTREFLVFLPQDGRPFVARAEPGP